MWLKIFQLSVRNLMLNKLRSLLTMLGTILGVSSVIAMLAIGEGSKRHAVEQIRQLGATNVIVRSVKPGQDDAGSASSGGGNSAQSQSSRVLEYGLRYDDLQRLQATLPTVRRAVPSILLRKDAQNGKHRVTNARVLGTTPEYQHVKNLAVRRGRFLVEMDLQTIANVAVLGAGAAQRLFSFEDPLDRTLLLGPGRLPRDGHSGYAGQRVGSPRRHRRRRTSTTIFISP
jgi:putative ABC transport system permease protein